MLLAIVGDRLLRLGDACAQPLDLLLQPVGRRNRRLALGILLQLDESVRNRVCDFGRERQDSAPRTPRR